jgi:hypothetical protein
MAGTSKAAATSSAQPTSSPSGTGPPTNLPCPDIINTCPSKGDVACFWFGSTTDLPDLSLYTYSYIVTQVASGEVFTQDTIDVSYVSIPRLLPGTTYKFSLQVIGGPGIGNSPFCDSTFTTAAAGNQILKNIFAVQPETPSSNS